MLSKELKEELNMQFAHMIIVIADALGCDPKEFNAKISIHHVDSGAGYETYRIGNTDE